MLNGAPKVTTVVSFPPIENPGARILVLGSMPGVLSLQANQYYAHPRNAFWPIMGALYDFDANAPYEARVEALKAAHVALWDVLRSCVRPGSLDSAIETGTRVANDFASFFQTHTALQCIAFNGAEAQKSFQRYVMPTIELGDIRLVRLPSTSPAHTLPLQTKIAQWRDGLRSPNSETLHTARD